MQKLSVSIDMGAKNNGLFIAKTDGGTVVNKNAAAIVLDGKKINFSKKSRRENRHKDRNYKRRRLAKRLLCEFLDIQSYTKQQQESIFGLLNNRGYTFLSTQTEFEALEDSTKKFFQKHMQQLQNIGTKEDLEEHLSENFSDENKLIAFVDSVLEKIGSETKKKKNEFDVSFQNDYKTIKDDLKKIREFLENVKKEIDTGSKPRKKYLQEIKDEIEDFSFIEDKKNFFYLVGNISNLQLRILRKIFNNNSAHKDRFDMLRKYFIAHHYKTDVEKQRRKELFVYLNNAASFKEALYTTPPILTIPPYEDMNNRDPYKCNSMLIDPKQIDEPLQQAVDELLQTAEFTHLLISQDDGVLGKEALFKSRHRNKNSYEKVDFTYSKYLQRILDVKLEDENKAFHPRSVFKYRDKTTIERFQKLFGMHIYNTLKPIAQKFYQQEDMIVKGLYTPKNSIFVKCGCNTPYKNNIKHVLLQPLYSYNFTSHEAESFMQMIKNTRGLKTGLELVASEAKKYQNGFYPVLASCYENQKCAADKNITKIAKDVQGNFEKIKDILTNIGIKESYFHQIGQVTKDNLSRVVNIFKQTYEVLFKDLNGFAKTCRECSKENAIRSDERKVIAKRLLSDVAKPIDGMLDMMLDRLAFEITERINPKDIEGIQRFEVLLEQNRFEFEQNLNEIKRASDPSVQKFSGEDKSMLNAKHCPYTGETFEKGDFDYILPQSKAVYNSKANMIYASTRGNAQKGNTRYTLEMLSKKHLQDIFKTQAISKVEEFIQKHIQTIDEREFKNFDRLKLSQQIAMRYALFMEPQSPAHKKAFELLRMDKIKTITNGTQKRLARKIYEKLMQKYPQTMPSAEVDSQTVNSELVSAARNILADSRPFLRKQTVQDSHSHCIDAMVVFYLANAKLKGQKHKQKEHLNLLEPFFGFDELYLEHSKIVNVEKRKTFINAKGKEIDAYPLFQGTIYSENYHMVYKSDDGFQANNKKIKQKDIDSLLSLGLLYTNKANKKQIVTQSSQIQQGAKIDVCKLSEVLHTMFKQKDRAGLKRLKFLDQMRFNTTRVELQNIFFDQKLTKLLPLQDIKKMPPNTQKSFRAVYNKLQALPNLFSEDQQGKKSLNIAVLEEFAKELYASKQKNPDHRKRGKKRHKFTLPLLGQNAKYRIKRGDTWQVLGSEKLAATNYIIDGKIKPIPYFSSNALPLKISDLIDCTLVDTDTKSVYHVSVDVMDVEEIVSLDYYLSEASRISIEVCFNKNCFSDIDFNAVKVFDGAKDSEFAKFIQNYLLNKESTVFDYAGMIRGGIKGKATLLGQNSKTITLGYKADTTAPKKQLILNNLS